MLLDSPYRPHNPGHDYYNPGTYLITLVVREREPLLASLGEDPRHPALNLSPLGKAVMQAWSDTQDIQRAKGRSITLKNAVCMPDHFHGVIRVEEKLDRHLGEIIRGFKMACTQSWRRLFAEQPCMVASQNGDVLDLPGDIEFGGKKLRNLSPLQREQYYAENPAEQPLFDANYDDSIAIDEQQVEAMVHYVLDNPRRAILRKAYPQLFERRLHVRIGEHEYAAFGNLFLLRWGWKVPVKCHRWRMNGDRRDYNTPYEQTEAFVQQKESLLSQAMRGAALVTPGISKGEQIIKNECLARHIPLIHLQKEQIGAYWKPEQSRFDACQTGMLLILAPWQLENMGTAELKYADGTVENVPADTDYSRFHNMNDLSIELSHFTGDAMIIS